MHFVNPPNDDPPEKCLFEYTYGGQDNVNGILNMTATMKQFKVAPPTTDAEKSVLQDALRFFVHFMGDIHQPLHDSTRDRGGNDAPIMWGRAKNNLHSLWDTLLITVRHTTLVYRETGVLYIFRTARDRKSKLTISSPLQFHTFQNEIERHQGPIQGRSSGLPGRHLEARQDLVAG